MFSTRNSIDYDEQTWCLQLTNNSFFFRLLFAHSQKKDYLCAQNQKLMKQNLFVILAVLLFATACGQQTEKSNSMEEEIDSFTTVLEGDSTIYGLVCDGCTDTILVFLPIKNISANPDTFNILEATRQHRIFGQLNVGDKVAVVRCPADSTIANYVIDMKTLCNTWRYEALPTLHVRADMVGRTEKQMINNLPDSIRELLSIPREYTMQIKSDNTAMSRGQFGQVEENAVVEYPPIKRYGQWHLFNGKLLLMEIALDTLGATNIVSTDTTELILLESDTLVLKFKDEIRGYGVKTNQESSR